jgi:hypothetical protein
VVVQLVLELEGRNNLSRKKIAKMSEMILHLGELFILQQTVWNSNQEERDG